MCRIQYAFARVIDHNVCFHYIHVDTILINQTGFFQSKLPKFVQINWCGDGVPEAKKGLFHTHSTAVAKFLRGTHVVINARNEVRIASEFSRILEILMFLQSDVTPALIMKRIEAASGAKYSAHNEQARKFEPIAPVGSSYTPVGRPDISAMRNAQPPPKNPPSAPSVSTYSKPSIPNTPRPVFRGTSSVQPAGTGKAPADAWEEEASTTSLPPQLPPATSRPPALPSASRPAFSVSVTFTHWVRFNRASAVL